MKQHHLTLSQLIAGKILIPAISYLRVSSEKQLRGEGLRRQREGNLAWIAKHPEINIRLDDEQTDEARSAWKADHVKDENALGSILRQVERGILRPPLMLIVEHLDRLSRENPWKAQEQLAGLVNRGILVATTKDDKIYSTESGIADLILSVVYMSGAHQESEVKSGRVSDTKRAKVEEAMTTKYVIHQNTVGWTRVAEPISPINRATRRYELIPEHAATVLAMYEMALHHGDGYIHAWLIEQKKPAMGRSGRWNIRHIKRILRSRAVLGHLESRHGLIEDIYPRIPGLTDELWLRVQAAIRQRSEENNIGGHKMGARVNLLAGIGVCHECGGRMRINNRQGRRYYECVDHVTVKTCSNRSRYRVDTIEEAIFDHLDFMEIGPVSAASSADLETLTDEHLKQVARLKRLENRLKELDDDDEFDLVMRQIRELRGKTRDAATALSAAQQEAATASAPVKLSRDVDRAELATGLKARLEKAVFHPKRNVLLRSRAGVALLIAAVGEPCLMFKAHHGGTVALRGGRFYYDEPVVGDLLDDLPPVDDRTWGEIKRAMRRYH